MNYAGLNYLDGACQAREALQGAANGQLEVVRQSLENGFDIEMIGEVNGV